jgi:hypothetical protein
MIGLQFESLSHGLTAELRKNAADLAKEPIYDKEPSVNKRS